MKLGSGMPLLATLALALVDMGCGSPSSQRTPTGPGAPAAGSEGRGVNAMAVAPPLGGAARFAVVGALPGVAAWGLLPILLASGVYVLGRR